MKNSLFLKAASACLFVALLSGCAQMGSWFGSSSVDQGSSASKSDIAPPPKVSPVPPVQSQIVPPIPGMMLPSAVNSGKVKVGLLLPMTGPNAGLGHAMLNAAQQAVFDSAAPDFELMPRDTGASDAGATQAARDALSNGATLLIGPLFATQVPGVAKVAAGANIPLLTLSTDTSLASPGLYVMGFSPGAQAEQVAQYALSHGLKHFAALVPGTAYGALVGQAFQVEVARGGGTMVAFETYDPAKRDINTQTHNIANKSSAIEALFLPEGGSDLALVTQQLSAAGVNPQNIHMLGTGLWDSYDTGRVAPFVIDGWYAAPDPTVRKTFIATYKSFYAEEPPRLATLAYDATALAAALAKRGARFDTAALVNPNGFNGLDGIFRLKLNGEVERGLAILQVTPSGSEVVDGAPPNFSRRLP